MRANDSAQHTMAPTTDPWHGLFDPKRWKRKRSGFMGKHPDLKGDPSSEEAEFWDEDEIAERSAQGLKTPPDKEDRPARAWLRENGFEIREVFGEMVDDPSDKDGFFHLQSYLWIPETPVDGEWRLVWKEDVDGRFAAWFVRPISSASAAV